MDKLYHVQYLPVAEEDIKTIFEYILVDDPFTAVKILDKFDEKIDHLSKFPFMGTIPRDVNIARMNYRVLIVETFLVFYVVFEDRLTVEIRRIINSKQKYDSLL